MTNLFPWKKVLNKFELVRSVFKRVCVARQNISIIQVLLLILLGCLFQAQLNNSLYYTIVFGFAHLRMCSVRHTCKISTCYNYQEHQATWGFASPHREALAKRDDDLVKVSTDISTERLRFEGKFGFWGNWSAEFTEQDQM